MSVLKVTLVFASMLLANLSYAQCNPITTNAYETALVFTNGVLTKYSEAERYTYKLSVLKDVNKPNKSNDENIDPQGVLYTFVHNWDHNLYVPDFLEAALQLFDQNFFKDKALESSEAYTRHVLLNSSLLDSAVDLVLPKGMAELISSFLSIASYRLQNAQLVATCYETFLFSNKSVYAVSHSQGGYFVNDAVSLLSTNMYKDKLAIYQVATPATPLKEVCWNYGKYEGDLIVKGFGVDANISKLENFYGEWGGHGFLSTYLNTLNAKIYNRIVSDLAKFSPKNCISKLSGKIKYLNALSNLNSLTSVRTVGQKDNTYYFVGSLVDFATRGVRNFLVLLDSSTGETMKQLELPGLNTLTGIKVRNDGKLVGLTLGDGGVPQFVEIDVEEETITTLFSHPEMFSYRPFSYAIDSKPDPDLDTDNNPTTPTYLYYQVGHDSFGPTAKTRLFVFDAYTGKLVRSPIFSGEIISMDINSENELFGFGSDSSGFHLLTLDKVTGAKTSKSQLSGQGFFTDIYAIDNASNTYYMIKSMGPGLKSEIHAFNSISGEFKYSAAMGKSNPPPSIDVNPAGDLVGVDFADGSNLKFLRFMWNWEEGEDEAFEPAPVPIPGPGPLPSPGPSPVPELPPLLPPIAPAPELPPLLPPLLPPIAPAPG